MSLVSCCRSPGTCRRESRCGCVTSRHARAAQLCGFDFYRCPWDERLDPTPGGGRLRRYEPSQPARAELRMRSGFVADAGWADVGKCALVDGLVGGEGAVVT